MARVTNAPAGLYAREALALTPLSAIPTTRLLPGALRVVSNSTSVAYVLNTTGTTWVWLNTTTVQPS